MQYLTNWQKVILRNYGIVPLDRIAKVLGTTENVVIKNAKKLGIEGFSFDKNWIKKGFVTIIRSNWDILSDDDIATLLGWGKSEFKKILVEYDFLDVKLGKKPKIEECKYEPLTVDQENQTEIISKIIKQNIVEQKAKPFEFFENFVEPKYFPCESPKIKGRFVSSYSAKYSGALLDDNLSDYNEDYLAKLAKTGTNGIWLSDTLRNLAEFPFDKSLSSDYKIRIKNLKKLTERCKKFGINVYLYMNEPRSLPESFFEKYPDMKGQRAEAGTYCLCTSNEKVKEYLYNGFKSIAKNCPLLKGIMTITMSENSTHCYSKSVRNADNVYTECSRCRNRKPQEVVSEVNNIIAKALKDGNGNTKLIANIWGWKNYSGSDNKEVFETIDLLDKDIEVLCVSEYGKEFVRGETKGKVDDYSISVVGPSDFSKRVLSYAKAKGHRIWAKIQINNSWECSAVPYIPVFDLMEKHVRNLQELNIDGIMLGWSLGGYVGGVLPLINSICDDKNFDVEKWYITTYEDNAKVVKEAVKIFSEAFTNYPFSVSSIYFGGHNSGPANLWDEENQNRSSTMVCFTFDDYEAYVNPYGIDNYVKLMQKVCNGFKKGLSLLQNKNGNGAFMEFINCALGSYIHFQSALNIATYSKAKRVKDVLTMAKCVESEMEITRDLLKLISRDSKIGFEMTNHYYYTKNILLEKLLNLQILA